MNCYILFCNEKPILFFIRTWGRLGFDRGCKAEQGISRAGDLVNPSRKKVNANDNSYAVAA